MEPGTSWPAPRQSRPGSPSSLETDTRQGLKTEGETAASLGCPAPTHSLGNKTSAQGSLLASCRRPPARGCGGWFSRSRIRVTLSHSAVGGSARINTVFSVGHLSRYLNITRASEGRTPPFILRPRSLSCSPEGCPCPSNRRTVSSHALRSVWPSVPLQHLGSVVTGQRSLACRVASGWGCSQPQATVRSEILGAGLSCSRCLTL